MEDSTPAQKHSKVYTKKGGREKSHDVSQSCLYMHALPHILITSFQLPPHVTAYPRTYPRLTNILLRALAYLALQYICVIERYSPWIIRARRDDSQDCQEQRPHARRCLPCLLFSLWLGLPALCVFSVFTHTTPSNTDYL